MLGGISVTALLIIIGVILVSLTIHEMVHAWVGFKLGDDTAAEEGRISLNPIRHIDPVMTVLLPIVTLLLVGAPILAAKPVPFNPDRLKFEEYGVAIVAAAGPFSNLLLAIVGVILTKLIGGDSSLLSLVLMYFITINVSLFVFNLIPIPPLDGSRVLHAFSPDSVRRVLEQMEPYGLFIVFGLVLLPGIGFGVFISQLSRSVLNLIGA